MKRLWVGGSLLLILLLAGVFFQWHGKRTEIRITEAQLQQQLQNRFPVERSMLLFIQWRLANPALEFLPGRQRVAVGLDVQLNLRLDGQDDALGGRIELDTALRYVDGEGAFYLVEPRIKRLAIAGLPEQHVMRVQDSLRTSLDDMFRKRPVYTLDPADLKQGVARLVLRDLRVEDREIVVVLGL